MCGRTHLELIELSAGGSAAVGVNASLTTIHILTDVAEQAGMGSGASPSSSLREVHYS